MDGNRVYVVEPKTNIDLGLPEVITRSLGGVLQTYNELREESGGFGDELGPHTAFALTGRCADETGTERRVKVQAVDGRINQLKLEQTSDVDSALGFVYEDQAFPFFEHVTFFWQILNNPSYTLESDLHLPKYTLPGINEEEALHVSDCLWG